MTTTTTRPKRTAAKRKPAQRKPSLEMILVKDIAADPDNPRGDWEQQQITPLAASISAMGGLLQPLIVQPNDDEDGLPYKIIAGERRYRAAVKAGRKSVECIVRNDCDRLLTMEIMLTENLHRRALKPLETARVVEWLCTDRNKGGGGYSAEKCAKRFGYERRWAETMRKLLRLPEPFVGMVADGKLSVSSARLLFPFIDDKEFMAKIAADMNSDPWAWQTYRQFKHSLAILSTDTDSPAPTAKATKRAAPARPPESTPCANGKASPAGEDPADESGDGADGSVSAAADNGGDGSPSIDPEEDLADRIAREIEALETVAELDTVQAAVARRRKYVAAASGVSRRKAG